MQAGGGLGLDLQITEGGGKPKTLLHSLVPPASTPFQNSLSVLATLPGPGFIPSQTGSCLTSLTELAGGSCRI